ncbi:MAG: ADP-forming succinate--CoA ligase subunit beta [Phycisphaerales bacterium]|nr:ADP-forming succinate--CoA ligase subunit beta [Phycisphaerales bacterium]
MNLHEYQAKELLKKYNVAVQDGIAVEDVKSADDAYRHIKNKTNNPFVVIKAQIHAGGRGKGRFVGTDVPGVKVVKNIDEATRLAKDMLGNVLVTKQTGKDGKRVNKIFIAEDMYYKGISDIKEYYLSILLDRSTSQYVIVYSQQGGMDIEEVSANQPDKILKEYIDPTVGLQPFQIRRMAFALGLTSDAFKSFQKFVTNLYNAFIDIDCAMLEINPLFKTSDNKIVAVDCKMNIDDNALTRHPELLNLRDTNEEDPTEVEAGQYNLNYVKLEGNVGCMVNGAGLAMATMDMIKLSGGDPANFLDIGGGANAQTVEAGFKIILKDPHVRAILINIFGGIVRCDRVATGIIEAYKKLGNISVPIIVRLQGTNAEEAKKIIQDSGLKVTSAILLSEASQLVRQAIS